MEIGSFGSEWEPAAGICEHRNELLVCMSGGEFPE